MFKGDLFYILININDQMFIECYLVSLVIDSFEGFSRCSKFWTCWSIIEVKFFGCHILFYINMGVINSIKGSTLSHLCLAIIFFTSGLIINFAQMILYCTVRLYSKRLFRKINWYLDYSLYSRKLFFLIGIMIYWTHFLRDCLSWRMVVR